MLFGSLSGKALAAGSLSCVFPMLLFFARPPAASASPLTPLSLSGKALAAGSLSNVFPMLLF